MNAVISIKGTCFIFLILLFGLSACAQTNIARENYPTVDTKEIINFPVTHGVYDHTFMLTNKEEWKVKISIPELTKNEQIPLVVALHWAGDHNTYQQYSECLVFPAFDTLNAIIIAPSSDGLHWQHPSNEKRVIELTKKIIKHWPVSKDQVIITGYSIGAMGSWNYAKKFPKLFCAAVPVAGDYQSTKIKIPVYVIHGEEDELFNYAVVENVINQSIKKGSEIELYKAASFSHYMACSYVDILREIALKIETDIFESQ